MGVRAKWERAKRERAKRERAPTCPDEARPNRSQESSRDIPCDAVSESESDEPSPDHVALVASGIGRSVAIRIRLRCAALRCAVVCEGTRLRQSWRL